MKNVSSISQSDLFDESLSPKQVIDNFQKTGNLISPSQHTRIIAIDPGDVISGFCVIQDGQIYFTVNLPNQFVVPKIREFLQYGRNTVVIEDVRPYGTRLTQQLLDTSKFIGELCYRLIGLKTTPELISRSEVRKWVFDTYKDTVLPYVVKKMAKKGKVNEDGSPRNPSFHYIDDTMVIKAMKVMWDIPLPKRGFGYAYGLKDHSWQALCLGSYFMRKH